MSTGSIHNASPFVIPEIASLICSFVDRRDWLNVSLSCRSLYHAAIIRIWHSVHPRSHMALRKLKNTLDGKARIPKTGQYTDYNRLVRSFSWTLKEDIAGHPFERSFFDAFLFCHLSRLEFSYAAAQDSTIASMIRSSPHLRYIDLSHCYSLSAEAIRPLLDTPPCRLETLILYGCGKINSSTLIAVINRHQGTLQCLRFTDITDGVLGAVQYCSQLQDIGLEHCVDHSLTDAALTRFSCFLMRYPPPLKFLRLRDIANLTSEHMLNIVISCGLSLRHLDMTECTRITAQGLTVLAHHICKLKSLSLAYQTGVTNDVVSSFVEACPNLKHLDLSGSLELTDLAFTQLPLSIMSLNVSGLESQLTPALIHQMLVELPHLNELCLGVAYDLAEADGILAKANSHGVIYQMDVEKCHTIIRVIV
ncbi:RNI-like protein [Hesseltinella vesiculosa]|uniref:RNI-like protein n=1 Tax=Hesseltinella vesiculosa TaxID=101127 RepID=A0A1X2G797_9FUNG|nr:RNI-like protein [Hesseltinella vesiculosa]